MDYIRPLEVVSNRVASDSAKAGLGVKHLLLRGFLSGALLGSATSPSVPVPIFVRPNPSFRLPSDAERPMIMIGPGTGVAPFDGRYQRDVY